MDTTLPATARSQDLGKSGARKVRKSGRMPATVYGPGSEPMIIEIEPYALTEMFRKSRNRNTVVELGLDGQAVPVLVREVQRHPVSREILHVDFYRVSKDRPVVVEIPVATTGKAKGLSLGGRVQIVRRTIQVRCAYDKIPAQFEVDVTPLDVGDSVRISQVAMPEGVSAVYDNDYVVVSLLGKQKERAEAAPAAEAAAPAAEGAKAEEKKE